MKTDTVHSSPLIIFRTIVKRIDEFFFPPLCIVCDKPRLPDERWFCPECLNHLIANHTARISCPRCSQNKKHRECTCDLLWEYPFESIYSLLDYDDVVQKIMHHVKYFNKKRLALDIGVLFSTRLPPSYSEGVEVIIPLPLHWIRKLRRGYNQAEWFGRGLIANHNEISFHTGILTRTRRTKTQVKLDRHERRKNVHGAFSVKSSAIKQIRGKAVMLVDDVITTGATTAAATDALLAAGALKVRVVSLARD